jgi:hypothetical protein
VVEQEALIMISELDETIKQLLIRKGAFDLVEVDISFENPDLECTASSPSLFQGAEGCQFQNKMTFGKVELTAWNSCSSVVRRSHPYQGRGQGREGS